MLAQSSLQGVKNCLQASVLLPLLNQQHTVAVRLWVCEQPSGAGLAKELFCPVKTPESANQAVCKN